MHVVDKIDQPWLQIFYQIDFFDRIDNKWIDFFVDGKILRNIVLLVLWIALFYFEDQSLVES